MPYIHFLSDKFSSTALPRICVPRPKLIKLFHKAAGKRVIFITAAAGYGKTVSTQLWLTESGRKHVWISLDRYDNTSSIFYKLASEGILSLQPDNSAMEEIYTSPFFASSPVEHTIRLISELSPDDKQYAIVLDDAHCLSNKELIKSGLLVQKRLPPSFVLLILTRNKTSEEYISAVGEDKCAIISEQELAFSTDEIHDYFNAHGRAITAREADEVYAITSGWAIGVKAMALSGKIEPQQDGGRIWDSYFEEQIWDKWSEDLREFMLKTAVTDTMTVELCQRLTGRIDSREVLETLYRDNTFISRVTEDKYCYHNLFLDFLRNQIKESKLDVEILNKQVAQYYIEREEFFIARRYAIKSEDLESLLKVIHGLSRYGSASLDDFAYFSKLDHTISENLCNKAPFLYATLMWENYFLGNAAEMEYYMDKVYQFFPIIKTKFPETVQTVMMHISLDHRVTLAELSERFRVLPSHVPAGLRGSTITHEMPFLHRSNRDYYELTDKQLLDKLKTSFGLLLNEHVELIFNALESGLLLEQNHPVEALEAALNAEKLVNENTSAELRIPVYVHQMSAYYVLRDQRYLEIMTETEGYIERSGAYNLRPNFLAFKARILLLDGDKRAAFEWLDNYFVTDTKQLELYKIYQYFTTVKAYVVLGETIKAMDYIVKLQQLCSDFRRPLDIAEAGVLRAIVEWASGMRNEAQLTLETVLHSLQQYRFIHVVAIEGAAILPVLKKLANKMKKGQYGGSLNAEYLHEVMLAAYEQSKRHKGIAANINGKPLKLSSQQKHVLTLLAHGYRYTEIAAELSITIHTVKSHVSAAYGKLEVNNALDAVVKARKLALID